MSASASDEELLVLIPDNNNDENIKKSPKAILFLLFVHFNLVLCNLIWGTMQVTNKWALTHYFTPIVFSTVRFFLSIPFLLLVCIASLGWQVKLVVPKKLKHFGLISVFGITLGLQQAVYISGLGLTTASNTAVLGCLSPAFGLVLALILRREKFYLLKFFGIIASVLGTLVIVDVFHLEITMGKWGDILVITSSVLVACNFLLQEYLSKLIGNSQQIVFWSIVFSFFELLLFSVIFYYDEWAPVLEFPLEAWYPVFYASIFATAFCYGMNGWCMKFVTPLIAISYITVQPISATILEWFLGKEITYLFVIGAILVILGIFFVLFGRYQESKDRLKRRSSQILLGTHVEKS